MTFPVLEITLHKKGTLCNFQQVHHEAIFQTMFLSYE